MSTKFLILLAFIIGHCTTQAQQIPGPKKGTLSAMATIAPGYMLQQKLSNIYIHGNLEYYPEKKVSIRGDGHYFIDSSSPERTLRNNHQLSFGALYHIIKGQLDLHFGLQPGIALSRLNVIHREKARLNSVPFTSLSWQVVPLLTIGSGINYYVHDYFHFLVNVRYSHGTYFPEEHPPYALSELSISAGLGFHISR